MSSAAPGSAERLWRAEEAEDFGATVLTAARQLGVPARAVEKDYWVCQALRAVVAAFPDRVIFKGGTSLEKLRLIQRFSEDLDLLVVGGFDTVGAGKRAMRAMCQVAADAVGSELEEEVSGGKMHQLWRRAYVTPPLTDDGPSAGLADPNRVLVELGEAGGDYPVESVPVTSLLAQVFAEAGDDAPAEFDDLRPFPVNVLHPGRTLLEKLLRVNNFSVNEAARDDEHGWPRIGRQFYDIWALLGDENTLAFLRDRDVASDVLADCYRISDLYTADAPAPAGGFARCSAFEPAGPLAAQLRQQHEIAMSRLYFGRQPGPTFDEVLERIHAHESLLDLTPRAAE